VISHPDKVLFPADGITKGELAEYYASVAKVMLPHLRQRPVTMERFPNGIGAGGFLQKDVSRGFPEWLERVEAPKRGGVVHDVLAELGLPSWPKTSGSKGFHIVVPLDAELGFDEVADFAAAVGRTLVERDPERLTLEFMKADRKGRIYMDTGRNGYSATFAAAYAVRARPGAPVSAPCTWDEIESGSVGPRTFTVRNMADRLAKVGDLWGDVPKRGRSLRRAIQRLAQRA
jgi:bifunctional non-homologous end joining protein LigD